MMFIYVEIFSSALVFHKAFDLGSFSLCSIVPIYFIAVATTFQFFGSWSKIELGVKTTLWQYLRLRMDAYNLIILELLRY